MCAESTSNDKGYCALHQYMHGQSNEVFKCVAVTCIGFIEYIPTVLKNVVKQSTDGRAILLNDIDLDALSTNR